MADATIVAASLNDEELRKSINKLVNHLDDQLHYMVASTKVNVKSINDALKTIGDVDLNFGGKGSKSGGTSKQVKAQEELAESVDKTTSKIKKQGEVSEMTFDQQASAINTAIKSEKKYTDEIQKQAAAIRATKEWQERGNVIIGDKNYYDPERQNVSKRQRAELLTLEEQILQVQQREAQEALVAAEAKRQQAQAAKEAANVSRPTPIYDIPNVGYYQMYEDSKRILHGGAANTSGMQKSAQEAQYLREQIAGLLEVNEREIKVANTASASYNQLAQYLKQLQSAYNRLGADRVAKGEGTDLANEIQRVQRAMQKLQQTMSRPISLNDALKLPDKTLDDMAYKMRQLSAYRSGLDVDKQKNEIEQVNKAYTSLQKQMNEVMQKNESLIGSNTALLRSWNYMKNRLAFYFTVGASTAFIRNLIEVRSQYEMNERALGILIDSAERGTKIFNELSQMALVSPYTLIELSAAAKQLTAYDVAAKNVVDTTRRLADMAAAVGIPIERLTYALGQIKAYGYLNSRDARMFANAGIPLVKQLSDYYTELEGKLVSTADVYDRIKKKAIDYNEVMEVINKMTDEGGKFFDFQAKMADTLKVRLANLTLAWNNMLNDIGKSSQGMLTWGIGALRELFLHWKKLDNAITNAGWALGIRTTLMFIAWGALKAGNAFGIMSKQMALSAVFGTKLANVLKNVGYSVIALAKNKWTWISLFAVAAVEASKALLGVNEAQKALNESIRNGAKDNYNNIKKFSEQYQEVRESLYKSNGAGGRTPVDIDNNEAKKVWDTIREQIELTVTSSDEYIGKLLSIENMSERVRQAFNLLDDVQVVNAALQEIDDNTIKIAQDWDSLFGTALLPEGLISDLKDVVEEENSIIEKFGNLSAAQEKANQGNENARTSLSDYNAALKEFRSELEETAQSVLNFIQVKGWSGDEGKINQVFSQIGQKIILDNQLDPQTAYQLQLELEEARSKAAKLALQQRINDERAAYKISHDESIRQAIDADIKRYNSWNEFNGRSKVEWERFTKWLKEQHISETTAMFRNMDAEDIKSLNFQEGKHAEWVTRMVTQYAKEHKMSYDEAFSYLKSWVRSANQWSIFIPLTISSEDKKSVYEQLGEYDKAIDDADAQIERLTKRINELNAKKKKSKEETQELANAEQELADAQKAKADAEAKGGHGKKEKKDEKAANKAAKQAETELQKALKDELSTIEKVRSIYKDLTKEGMSHANAVEKATSGWDETVNAINRVLQKNGLQRLDLTKFAGVANPRELVNMLQSQLDVLVRRGAKPAEIKELQTKIQTLKVDADKYDLTMITNGLNNELGKLKDEYELAVELDADPEMGNMFASYFGIDTNEFPRTFQDAAKKAQAQIDKIFKENGRKDKVDILSMLNKESFDKWVKDSGLKMDSELVKAVEQFRQYLHKVQGDEIKNTTKNYQALIEKYGGLQAQLLKIYKDSVKKQGDIVRRFGNNAQIKQALDLIRQINISQDPAEITRLQEQLATVMRDVVNGNPIAMKTYEASQNEQKSKESKAYWEDFKNSDMYSMVFADMANNSIFSIELIIQKLNELKDKVKEDPTSMKELIRSLENAKEEFAARNPIQGIIDGVDRWTKASQRLKDAKNGLAFAIGAENNAKQQVKDAEQAKDTNKLAVATAVLASATANREKQEKRVAKASNDVQQAQEDTKKSIKGVADTMKGAQDTLSGVSAIFKAFGDDETAEAIDAINQGFSAMISVVMGVYTAMQMLNTAVPWLLAISAALAVIVGLVSFLSGHSDKKITEQVEESERAVKKLENRVESLKGTYDAMTDSAEHSYGAQSAAATLAASSIKEQEVALKRLMLSETKRQLRLEQSRDSKKRDDDKILSLQKDIISQQNEIDSMLRETSRAVDEVVDSLLGISRGSWAEELTDAMITAFKAGEDYMDVFEDSWEEMVQNMVVKTIAARVIGDALEKNVLSRIKQIEKEETDPYREAAANIEKHKANLQNLRLENENEWLAQVSQLPEFAQILGTLGENAKMALLDHGFDVMLGRRSRFLEQYGDQLEQALFKIYDNYNTGIDNTLKQAQQTAQERALREVLTGETGKATKQSLMDSISSVFPDFMETWGVKFGQDAEKELSALQRGVQSVTEGTAESIVAYMNGVSQQVYLHSTILTQIRDAVVAINGDVQLSTMSQMLLQLQNNYIVMQSMQAMMENWTIPSGQGIRVELMS